MKGLLAVMGKPEDTVPKLKGSGDNNVPEVALEDDANQAGFEAAAQDAFQAIKTGDASMFRDALQSAIEMSR